MKFKLAIFICIFLLLATGFAMAQEAVNILKQMKNQEILPWALNILGSCADNTIHKNNFLNNSFDVSTNTSRNYNNYSKNYWSENTGGYDLDKDGISDVPYRPVKLFSYMIANMQSATILMRSLLVDLINHAENLAPVITPHDLMDNEPLMYQIDHDRDKGTEQIL